MPNLVGLQNVSPPPSSVEDEKHKLLVDMQLEALGLKRREYLSTTDYRENRANYVTTASLEPQRLVNKGSIGSREKSKLEGWNNAWTSLQDDGTDSQKLRDVNEGLGQTHRAKLMYDDSVREYSSESSFRGGRGGIAGRGDYGGRGGRGGGNAGRATGRGGRGKAKGVTSQIVPHQPITRARVPKGYHLTALADVPHRQSAPPSTTASVVKPAKGNVSIPRLRVASNQPPISLAAPNAFMASVNTSRKHPRDEPNIKVPPSDAIKAEEQADGHNHDISILTIQTTANPSKEKVDEHVTASLSSTSDVQITKLSTTTAADKPGTSVSSRPTADLMDLDIGREAMHPVLEFTAPSIKERPHYRDHETRSLAQTVELWKNNGSLNAEQLEDLEKSQASAHTHVKPLTPLEKNPRQGIQPVSEPKSLRPATTAIKHTTSIARNLEAEQKAFLIGEHVHKTRFLTGTVASLTKGIEKLSISEKEPIKPVAPSVPSIEKSKVNPFGPSPTTSKGPSLPTHLLGQSISKDHGSAARAQYLGGQNISAQVADRRPLGNVIGAATRRNKVNETGFIALAENRVNDAAGKKGQDPLLVAHKRGL